MWHLIIGGSTTSWYIKLLGWAFLSIFQQRGWLVTGTLMYQMRAFLIIIILSPVIIPVKRNHTRLATTCGLHGPRFQTRQSPALAELDSSNVQMVCQFSIWSRQIHPSSPQTPFCVLERGGGGFGCLNHLCKTVFSKFHVRLPESA